MKYIIDGQRLYPFSRERTVADKSVDFVDLEFCFSADWAGMQKTAQFTQNGKTYNKVLKDDTCKLPVEVTSGLCLISVFGYRGQSRGTTIPYPEEIRLSGFVADGETPVPPTPDLYAQLLEDINLAVARGVPYIGENLHWFTWDAEAGEYADTGVNAQAEGKPGDPGKSAYESAKDGGYTGTEEEFNKALAGWQDEDLLLAMKEAGLVDPLVSVEGALYTDGDGKVYIL